MALGIQISSADVLRNPKILTSQSCQGHSIGASLGLESHPKFAASASAKKNDRPSGFATLVLPSQKLIKKHKQLRASGPQPTREIRLGKEFALQARQEMQNMMLTIFNMLSQRDNVSNNYHYAIIRLTCMSLRKGWNSSIASLPSAASPIYQNRGTMTSPTSLSLRLTTSFLP